MNRNQIEFLATAITDLEDLDNLILVLEGKKAIMEAHQLTTQKAYLEFMEARKKKRGEWLAKVLKVRF